VKILLLAGGISAEHDVSVRSGDNVEKALIELRHTVVRADPAATGFDLNALATDVGAVFPILHGEGGEDGVLQEQLEIIGVPFLGSDSRSSRIAFDKEAFKELMDEHAIPVPKGEVVSADSFTQSPLVSAPFVLKPIDGGSSIDTHIERVAPVDVKKFSVAFSRHTKLLLEELIEGQEITVGILGEEALPIILITPPEGGEFDYENKYNGKSQEQLVTHELSDAVQAAAKKLALQVHKAVGCRDLSRVDIIVRSDGSLVVLEINTIPGLTSESLLPKAAAGIGLSFTDLVDRFVHLVR